MTERPWELGEDRALLAGFRRGDATALEKVFRNYAPAVEALLRSGFAYDRGGQRARMAGLSSTFDVEDRLHEVFARAFSETGRRGYDGIGPYGAYLHGVTRNLLIDQLRKSGRETLLADPIARHAEHAPTSSPTDPIRGDVHDSGHPERDTDDRQLLALVATFRAGLAPRDREVFELRFVEDLAHPEIAAKSGLSPSQIKTSEKRIREGLFEHLQAHGYLTGYVATRHGWLRWLGGGGRP